MGLNPVQQISVTQKQKEDGFDKIIKALTIGKQAFGIATDIESLVGGDRGLERESKKAVIDLTKAKTADANRKAQGLLTPQEQVAADLRSTQLKNEQAKLAENLKKQGQGKPLQQSTVLKVSEGNTVPVLLGNLDKAIGENEDLFGPAMGRVRSINPFDTRAQVFDAQIRASAQAFGRLMEGGVLRKEDEEKYRRMFPQLSDTAAVAKGKMKIVRDMMEQRQKSAIDNLKGQGLNVESVEREFKQATKKSPKKSSVKGLSPVLSGEEKQAVDWARKNPNDPRAKEIMKELFKGK